MNLPNKYIVWILASLIGTAHLLSANFVNTYVDFDTTLSNAKHILTKFEAPLSDEEEQKCLAFLKYTFAKETIAFDRVRQNDLADWMLQRPAHVEATTEVLLEVLDDESADLLWREFCIQKLALAASQPSLSKSLKAKCYKTLLEKTTDATISFSGTALLGLYRLHVSNPEEFSASKLLPLAENVINQNKFSMANKVTALQVAGLLESQEALEYARSIVQSEEPIQLRISAIALLAKKGNTEDLGIIRSLNQSKDLRLRRSSSAAVAKLEN